MREILFKGKEYNTNKWVQGYLFKQRTDGADMLCLATEPLRANDYSEIKGYCEIYPQSIGQYTGFKDKNGNKIFEGDILTNSEGATYLVFFDGSEGKFDWARLNENYEHSLAIDHSDFAIKCNKFDYPELAFSKNNTINAVVW